MPTTTWDSAFEAAPADSDEYKYGANKMRELKTAISERLELEMNFKTGTQPLIKAGQAAVIYSGNTAQIAALANVANGALAWNTTTKNLQRSNGTSYANLDVDHGSLSGLTDDDHTQYLKLDKTGQTLSANLAVTANITIDGVDISSLNANASQVKFMDTPVNKANLSATANWTDIDIANNTSTDTAKAAILAVAIQFKGNSSAESFDQNTVRVSFRKNGSSVTANLARVQGTAHYAYFTDVAGMAIVECDANEVFEYKVEEAAGNAANLNVLIDLVGYIT